MTNQELKRLSKSLDASLHFRKIQQFDRRCCWRREQEFLKSGDSGRESHGCHWPMRLYCDWRRDCVSSWWGLWEIKPWLLQSRRNLFQRMDELLSQYGMFMLLDWSSSLSEQAWCFETRIWLGLSSVNSPWAESTELCGWWCHQRSSAWVHEECLEVMAQIWKIGQNLRMSYFQF